MKTTIFLIVIILFPNGIQEELPYMTRTFDTLEQCVMASVNDEVIKSLEDHLTAYYKDLQYTYSFECEKVQISWDNK